MENYDHECFLAYMAAEETRAMVLDQLAQLSYDYLAVPATKAA